MTSNHFIRDIFSHARKKCDPHAWSPNTVHAQLRNKKCVTHARTLKILCRARTLTVRNLCAPPHLSPIPKAYFL